MTTFEHIPWVDWIFKEGLVNEDEHNLIYWLAERGVILPGPAIPDPPD